VTAPALFDIRLTPPCRGLVLLERRYDREEGSPGSLSRGDAHPGPAAVTGLSRGLPYHMLIQ
jgi:hypothetical protein